MLEEVGDRLEVYLDDFERPLLAHKVLCQHSCAGPDFEDGRCGAGIDGVGDGLGDALVAEEVLPQKLFRLDGAHSCEICGLFTCGLHISCYICAYKDRDYTECNLVES